MIDRERPKVRSFKLFDGDMRKLIRIKDAWNESKDETGFWGAAYNNTDVIRGLINRECKLLDDSDEAKKQALLNMPTVEKRKETAAKKTAKKSAAKKKKVVANV